MLTLVGAFVGVERDRDVAAARRQRRGVRLRRVDRHRRRGREGGRPRGIRLRHGVRAPIGQVVPPRPWSTTHRSSLSSSPPTNIDVRPMRTATITSVTPNRIAIDFRRSRFSAASRASLACRVRSLLSSSLVCGRHRPVRVVARPPRNRPRAEHGRAGTVAQRDGGPEVRRNLGRRPRPDPGRRRSHRPHPAQRRRRRGRRLGDGQDDRRPRPARERRRRARPAGREMDMLLTAGERISMALLCMAVEALGRAGGVVHRFAGRDPHRHRPRQGQDPRGARPTASARRSTRARSRSSPASRVSRPTRDITTLGRGGSDTTAVALAAALGADVCEIYTDVEGVYSADPRIVPTARKLAHVSFDEMLEMAATGGRVLALRSVEFARNHGVKVHVRSSFTWAPGTWVTEEDPSRWSKRSSPVSRTTCPRRRSRSSRSPTGPVSRRRVFRTLAEAGINVDMIVQNVSTAGHTDISFTLPRDDVARARRSRWTRSSSRPKPPASAPTSDRAGLARRRGHEDASRASRPRCSRRSPTRASTSR